MFIPNKPAKYGIQLITYRNQRNALNYLLHKKIDKEHPWQQKNVNMDNWFTSIRVADEILQTSYNLTLVGTVRRNEAEIPPEMLELGKSSQEHLFFGLINKKTLVSYLLMAKEQKLVNLLLTMHTDRSLNTITKKPEIKHFYSETKYGAGTFDQMCSSMNCGRKTRSQPMCVFYDVIKIAAINSFGIYNSNRNKNGGIAVSRTTFMLDLKDELIHTTMVAYTN